MVKSVKQLERLDKKIVEDDIKINKTMGKYGSELFSDKDTIMTHCNAGALATVAYGTALGVIRATKESGKDITDSVVCGFGNTAQSTAP